MRIITEICQALDYAHSQGIIHRDVKPSNIILNEQGRAFLSDFGLALLQAEGTRGEIFGSPYYIAPEQAINSAGAVPQSDLYALGVVLYQMLTGSVPFDEGSMMDIAMAHMTDAPPSPLFLNPQLHPALVPVLDIALRKEPSARYQSGTALAGALGRAIQISAQPSHATKPGSTRLSMLSVPDKVSEFRKGHPLPPLPAEVPAPRAEVTLPAASRDASASPTPAIDTDAAPATVPATGVEVRPQPVPAARREALLPLASSRKTSLFIGAGVGVVACLALALILLLLTSGPGNSETALATETVMDVAAAATTTPLPTRTTMPTSTPIGASPTAVVLVPTTIFPTQVVLIPTTAVPTPVVVVPAATPSPQAVGYELLLVKRGEDSLFVINQTASYGLPLAPLQLGDGRGAISGTEWGLEMLDAGACVAAWKDGGHPRAPDVDCTPVGEHLTRRGGERFWKNHYDVFYNGVLVETCSSDDCLVRITGG